MELHFKKDNGPVDQVIQELLGLLGNITRPKIVREMIIASLKAGQEDDGAVDLKLMNNSLKEMRFTAKAFGPYRHVRKVAVFGSARTSTEETTYKMAISLGQKLAASGYMVITGGGPGIMQAVHEGAGSEYSFGVNIRLPFEQKANPVIDGNPKSITYKYFFNRKVAFLKESDAIVLFPGGFGTLDEGMEALTLVQTGKRNPVPILLVDEPEGTYWKKWAEFVEETILSQGNISKSDLALFERIDSTDVAVERIKRFYSRYHSLRYIGNFLVIRLRSAISQHKLEDLRSRFSEILRPQGEIYLSGPLPEEIDEPEIRELPRLVLDFDRKHFGGLKALIDSINSD
ncbi:MAG: TIGR00730 family Rossman fold protein [Thermodesulfobacteriota bacterium]|nr:TIGR00730 family Rossman fold protein [Thermodesulfobacteriota bacterium]